MTAQRVSTGVPGFDEILGGGFLPNRAYLVSGPPGTGKTTLGWHFLTAGAALGESALYVTFAEPGSELVANAVGLGFDVRGVEVVDLSPGPDVFSRQETYDLFSASEVERQPTTARIVEAIERLRPRRVFVDSMTSLRFLTTDAFQFRRQALSFLRYLAAQGATVFITSESTTETPDDDFRFIVDGVIELALQSRTWGLRVTKLRGSGFRSGVHGLRLGEGGAVVFPRLLPEMHAEAPEPGLARLSSGNAVLDEMLHGGIEHGSVTLMSGPTGVGKTTLGLQFLCESARRGERAALYTFDERKESLLLRAAKIGIPVDGYIADETLAVRSIEALRYGADEFAQMVRHDVEMRGTRTIMIDSVSGYRMTIQGTDLAERLHALGRYVQNVGATLILVDELRDLQNFRISEVGISYLADNVIFLRYVERITGGKIELRKGIGILKKRLGDFEKQIREYRITPGGIEVGDALRLSSIFARVPFDEDSHPPG